MKIALAQINPTVGDLLGNKDKIEATLQKAEKQDAEVVVFPELCLTGYPPKDLLLKKSFVRRNKEFLRGIAEKCKGVTAIVGFVDLVEDKMFNAAAVLGEGKILHVYHKMNLPNYDVFDEKRYFSSGDKASVVEIKGVKMGVNICEDIWVADGPSKKQVEQGAEIIINLSASPYHAGKGKIREELIAQRAREIDRKILYLNLVGAQDDLIFDGRSYVFNEQGKVVCRSEAFREDLQIFEWSAGSRENEVPAGNSESKDIHDALVLGIKDYFRKNGFTKAIIGLSGGIDSAITAALAVEALGKENVVGISMPSKFSSSGSINDSKVLADNLGMEFHVLPIKEVFNSYLQTLEPHFRDTEFNVAEENIQARIRGNLLMAMSNKFGYLVLATGNKSELSVGYATLYGDMAGGLAVISDVLKLKVYELSRYVNDRAGKEIIPEAIIVKEPSAELREDQKDSDSLPEYKVLDPILEAYVENDKSKDEIINLGFEEDVVTKVISMVDRNEYKRQQAALGLKITPRAFGSGRRMPITNKWRETWK